MTILMVHAEYDRVLIAQDTLLYNYQDGVLHVLCAPDGTPRAISKFHALPHLRAVLAHQGALGVTGYVVRQSICFLDFDAAEAGMPALLTEMAAGAMRPWLDPANRDKATKDVLILAGFSADRNRVACVRYESSNGFEESTIKDMTPAARGWCSMYVTPKTPTPEKATTTPQEMLTHAKRMCTEGGREVPYGGTLHTAEISRDAIVVCKAGELGLPDWAPTLLCEHEDGGGGGDD